MLNDKWTARWQASMVPSYATPKLTLSRGEGVKVWDVEGNEYLDLLGGLAVSSLGHAHPAILHAVNTQMQGIAHTSNLYANEPSIELAERLLDLFGVQSAAGRVFFCNSGAEANEAAFKLARRTGRPNVIATTDGFHGRTMGSLSLTGQSAKREPFLPLFDSVTHVPYGDIDALRAAVDHDTAAFFVEPILGEAGVVMPPDGYLAAARQITRDAGALLVVDEVQTGLGRTGAWFAFEWEHIEPDVVTLAKGLAGGLPIGACIALGDAATLFEPGQHGSTFGGNPVSCAAALAVINTINDEGLVAHAAAVGRKLMLGIDALRHPLTAGVRGRGVLVAVGLTKPVAHDVVAAAARAGFLINATSSNVIRLAPPLIIEDSHVNEFLQSLPELFDAAS